MQNTKYNLTSMLRPHYQPRQPVRPVDELRTLMTRKFHTQNAINAAFLGILGVFVYKAIGRRNKYDGYLVDQKKYIESKLTKQKSSTPKAKFDNSNEHSAFNTFSTQALNKIGYCLLRLSEK